jgi:hypothetical protein
LDLILLRAEHVGDEAAGVGHRQVLHPAIALGAVFANILAIFYWNWFIATWLGVPALQLFAYEMADYLGKDVDQPRNLAKSVTVE